MNTSSDMFQAASSGARVKDDYIQPTMGHALRIWWAYYWPTTLISLAAGLGLGLVLPLVHRLTNVPLRMLSLAAQAVVYVLTFGIAIFIFQYILGKTFRHFRIGLRPKENISGPEELEATLERTVRVWWTFLWRTIVYLIGAWVVVMLPFTWYAGILRPSPLLLGLVSMALGFAIGAAVSLFVIYSNILDEEFGDFRVCLLARRDASPAGAGVAVTPPQP